MKHFVCAVVVAASWSLAFPAHAEEQPREPETYTLPTGLTLDFEEVWRRHVQRYVKTEEHWWRAIGEEAATLALGAAWYWASRELNSEDWDVDADFGAISKRFTSLSYVRFDTNRFFVNQGHVLAGAAYYGWARTNNIGPFASLAVAMITSAAWEYLLEFREYISLNDLVTSPYGGQAMGEVLYKWGELYRVMGDDLPFAARALTIVFAGPRALHEALGDEPIEPWDPADGPPMQHDFGTYVGAVMRTQEGEVSGGAGSIELDTMVVDMPGWHMPGRFDTFYRDGNFTRLNLAIDFDGDGVDRTELAARAMIAGYYQQNITDDRWGHALTLGLSRGAWFDLHEHTALFDRIAMVDVVGPALVVDVFMGGVRGSASLRTYFDLGAVTPLAYPSYVEARGDAGVRSELAREGYYFAYGGNFIPAMSLQWGPFRGELEMEYSRFRDFRGPDRIYLGDVPRDLRLLDTRMVMRTSLELAVHRGLGVKLSYDHTTRSGITESFTETRKVPEISLNIGYRY